MFIINETTTFRQLQDYLKTVFRLKIHPSNQQKIQPDYLILKDAGIVKKNKKTYINGESRTGDIFNLLPDFKVDIRTLEGNKINKNCPLKECENTKALDNSNEGIIKSQLATILSISQTSTSYAELDWIMRIFKEVAVRISNDDELILLIEAIEKVLKLETKFSIIELKDILRVACKSEKQKELINKKFHTII